MWIIFHFSNQYYIDKTKRERKKGENEANLNNPYDIRLEADHRDTKTGGRGGDLSDHPNPAG